MKNLKYQNHTPKGQNLSFPVSSLIHLTKLENFFDKNVGDEINQVSVSNKSTVSDNQSESTHSSKNDSNSSKQDSNNYTNNDTHLTPSNANGQHFRLSPPF